ncbi:MAG: fatty acid desaturase [Thermoanaerobaculia bacterium]|nr:fatty acid desaturase [Thermoanaerobaculia bacterium]
MQTTTAEKDWVNILFLMLTPIIGVFGTAWYTIAHGFEWWMLGLGVVMYFLVGLSITAGYHRLFSHRTYEASRAVEFFFAVFGALAAQNSILWWSASHRVHHRFVDRDWDPYNIQRGFWWAHIFWIFYKNPDSGDFSNSKDLLKNPVVMWQHRWHYVIMVVVGFGLPALVGAFFGDWVAGLLWGGFVRLVFVHQSTFFVNSLAHKAGAPTFDANVSARDNWAVALVTLGEGYHSFHHRFPGDFRNGIRWYQWDPSKWFIRGLQAAGQAWSLRRVPAPSIEQARMEAAVLGLEPRLAVVPRDRAEEIRQRINAAREEFARAIELWRRQAEERADGFSTAWKETRREAKRALAEARRDWKRACVMLSAVPAHA